MIPEIKANVPVNDLQLVTIGFTNLLTQSKTMLADPYFGLWPGLLEALLKLLANPLASSVASSTPTAEDELAALEQEDGVYQANYSKLTTVGTGKKNYTAHVSDPRLYLAQSLAQLAQAHPGKVASVVQQQLSMESGAILKDFARDAGIPLR